MKTNGSTDSESPGTAGFDGELQEALAGRVFQSAEDAQRFLEAFTERRNRTGRAEFHGLSPEQMWHLLSAPFDSPQVVDFAEVLDIEPVAPVVTLFDLLVQHIGEKGLKPTQKGNLPRKVCREVALAYWGEEGYEQHTRFGQINTESDFFELHVTRLIAGLAGLIRNYKGRFVLTSGARKLQNEAGSAGIYPRLLRAHAERYNWAYPDRYPDLFLIQRSFAFTLYLLCLHGSEERSSRFYEDAFSSAFPMLLQETPPTSYSSPEDQLRSCYRLRSLERFAAFFGLASVVPIDPSELAGREYRVTKLPLLDAAIRFPTLHRGQEP